MSQAQWSVTKPGPWERAGSKGAQGCVKLQCLSFRMSLAIASTASPLAG
jgi:hypothetical protein